MQSLQQEDVPSRVTTIEQAAVQRIHPQTQLGVLWLLLSAVPEQRKNSGETRGLKEIRSYCTTGGEGGEWW